MRRRQSANGQRIPPDGVVLTLTDISALEHARARLAQLSAIVESSDDAIIGKTLDGIITTWNGGAFRLYGYSAEEAIGHHASFLYPPGAKRRSTPFSSRYAPAVPSIVSRRSGYARTALWSTSR